MVRLDAPYRSSLDAIGRIPVGGPRGATLADVSEIKLVSGVSYIYREDASRYLPIRFSVRGRDPASTVAEAQEAVALRVELPPGYRLEWVGEFRNLQEAIGRLMVVVPVALALILVLLYVQFSNLRETLLVFGIVPMSIIGGVGALAASGLNFSVPAAIGFLALFGITVMEGIIMMSHFNHLLLERMPWRQALDQAGQDRMRPVFMTCFASFAGLLPMALATGIGADVQKPLALVVVGGIGLVPVFILVVFPAMIDLFGRSRRARALERATAAAAAAAARRRRRTRPRGHEAAGEKGRRRWTARAGRRRSPGGDGAVVSGPGRRRRGARHARRCRSEPHAEPLTLDRAERLLFERNLALVAARRGVDAARAQRLVASSLPPPQVTVGSTLGPVHGDLGAAGCKARGS